MRHERRMWGERLELFLTLLTLKFLAELTNDEIVIGQYRLALLKKRFQNRCKVDGRVVVERRQDRMLLQDARTSWCLRTARNQINGM